LSPILVRPVREQLEHDRIIRLLQTKCRRKYEAGMNPGAEQTAAVGSGPTAVYPDLVLLSLDRSRRLEVVVEVETGESVNHLEALAQWVPYSKLKAAFHLYVPSGMVDVARRLCEDNHIDVGEIWSYHAVGEDVRFTLVHKGAPKVPEPAPRRVAAAHAPAQAAPTQATPAAPAVAASPRKPAAETPKRAVRTVKTAPARKPVKKAAARGQAGRSAASAAVPRTQKRK
jgi:hypothetical protein